MIRRTYYLRALETALSENPVAALLGPRQCGKTTLARQFMEGREPAHYFDLETAAGRSRLAAPELALSPLEGLVVIDEIQRLPGLFETLRRFWMMVAHFHRAWIVYPGAAAYPVHPQVDALPISLVPETLGALA